MCVNWVWFYCARCLVCSQVSDNSCSKRKMYTLSSIRVPVLLDWPICESIFHAHHQKQNNMWQYNIQCHINPSRHKPSAADGPEWCQFFEATSWFAVTDGDCGFPVMSGCPPVCCGDHVSASGEHVRTFTRLVLKCMCLLSALHVLYKCVNAQKVAQVDFFRQFRMSWTEFGKYIYKYIYTYIHIHINMYIYI